MWESGPLRYGKATLQGRVEALISPLGFSPCSRFGFFNNRIGRTKLTSPATLRKIGAQMIRPLKLIRLVATCAITVASIAAQTADIADMRRQAEAGDAKAQFRLAAAYIQGTGIAKDPKQGLEWLRKSASQGYVGAEFALADMYQTGVMNLPKDPHEAANWFRKAAKQQNEAAQTHLSQMLAQGVISKQEADWHEPVPPKPPKKNRPTAFSLAEVETGLTGGITTKRMASLVNTYGVDFSLSASARKRLADDGADDNLLATISASKF